MLISTNQLHVEHIQGSTRQLLHLTETQAPQIAVLKLGPLMLSQADHSYLHSPTLILPAPTIKGEYQFLQSHCINQTCLCQDVHCFWVVSSSEILSSSLTNLPPNINTQFFCCTKASSISFSRPGATAGKLPPTLPKQPLQTRTLLIIQHVKILHTKAGKRLHMQDQYLGTHFSRCSQELSTILLIQMQLFKGTEWIIN